MAKLKCDWCGGQFEGRYHGAHICTPCWRAYIAKENARKGHNEPRMHRAGGLCPTALLTPSIVGKERVLEGTEGDTASLGGVITDGTRRNGTYQREASA